MRRDDDNDDDDENNCFLKFIIGNVTLNITFRVEKIQVY